MSRNSNYINIQSSQTFTPDMLSVLSHVRAVAMNIRFLLPGWTPSEDSVMGDI
jgi:hypothetical protein